jgi:RTX calcium-binding nonapeptide repeat (4 copies)
MSRLSLRRARIATAATAVAASGLWPSSATAVTRVYFNPTDPDSGVSAVVVDGDPSRNNVRVWWDADRRALYVRDNQLVVAPRCKRLRPTSVRCPVKQEWLSIYSGPGRDRVSLHRGVPDSLNALIYGGQHRDLLIGGPESDELTGGPGNDVIAGGKGDDRLVGQAGVFARAGGPPGQDTLRGGAGDDHLGNQFESGSDRLFGGAGNDSINAGHPDRDRRIDGGPGRDRCVLSSLDRSPTRCEDIERISQ